MYPNCDINGASWQLTARLRLPCTACICSDLLITGGFQRKKGRGAGQAEGAEPGSATEPYAGAAAGERWRGGGGHPLDQAKQPGGQPSRQGAQPSLRATSSSNAGRVKRRDAATDFASSQQRARPFSRDPPVALSALPWCSLAGLPAAFLIPRHALQCVEGHPIVGATLRLALVSTSQLCAGPKF